MKNTWLAVAGLLTLALGAKANIISQEQSYSGLTDWTQNLSFNQFDTQLGVLNSVTINLTGSVLLTSSVKNNAAGTSSFNITEDFTLDGAVPSSSSLTLTKSLHQSYSIASGATVGQTSSGTASQNDFLTGDLSAWEGLGTVILAGDAHTEFSYSISGGNNNVVLTSTAGLDATVVYDYTSVPEGLLPLWAALGGFAGVFWIAARQRKPLVEVRG